MKRFAVRSSVAAVAAALTLGPASAAVAASPVPHTIVLPGAHSAEGVAVGPGSTFYAGELFTGDIFRGDLQTGAAALFIDAPDGRMKRAGRVNPAGPSSVLLGRPSGRPAR